MNKKLILPLIVLLILVVTFGLSVAFFSYAKIGNKESSIQIGELTFKYTETSGKGQGINLDDAFPLSDQEGKVLDEYFDFKVEANLTRSDIAYRVELDTTLSDIPSEGIKVYLTEVVDGNEVEINSIINTLSTYEDSTDGKVIYTEIIPRNTKNYVKNFRLRLWIDENVDWTSDSYMGHSATYKVNVKANSDSSMAATDTVTDKTTSIERVVANNMYLFTTSGDTGVDYEVTVPYTVDNVDIEVYESNTQATSVVTPINSLNGVSSKSTSQNIHTGNNYFKVVTTASNGTTQEEHILKVVKEADTNNDLLNLGVEGYSLTPSFDKDTTNYTLILEEPSITITGNKASDTASITGLGEKTLVFGDNTFDITVTSESGVDKTYTITVTNERPTAPNITGGTGTTWVNTAKTITLDNPNLAFAISGIDHYEVYDVSDSTVPTDNTVATTTTTDSYIVDTTGTHYIYYRTVSNKESKSAWSSPQIVYLDTNTYTITYDLDGGSATNPTSYDVETATFTLNNPTRTGYAFAGWTGSNGNTKQTTVSIAKGSTGDKSYTANWTANTFTVAYNGNGNTGGSTASHNCTYDGSCELARNGFTKTGYTFAGWKKANAGTALVEGASIANEATSGTITYYAQWTIVNYTISYTLNSGSATNPTSYNVNTTTFTLSNPTRTGYAFAGWTGSNGNTKQTTVSIAKGSTGDKSYTANWTANRYTITLNNQSATSAGSTSVNATYDSAVPSITVPTKTGYIFGGYYTSTNGGGTQYIAANGTSARTWNIASNTTLYAKWTPIQYTFKFNANGGSGSMSNQTFNYGTAQNLRANAFSNGSKTFVGWSTVSGTQLLYSSTAVSTGTNEFLKYGVDLSPYFNTYGSRVYSLRFDIKSANVSKQNFAQVYAQNGDGTRWEFYVGAYNLTTSYQTRTVTFTPTLDNSSISESQLAFYGTYNTGNILSVKNVYLTLGEYHLNQESINNYTTTNGQTINLYAVWK